MVLGSSKILEKQQEVNETGQTKKVTTIITPGGEFSDGERTVKASSKVVNVFSKSPQRKDKLDHVRNTMDMPNIALQNYPETRVGYTYHPSSSSGTSSNLAFFPYIADTKAYCF